MIDFTNVDEEYNIYKGREKKKTFIYNEKKYLVKFPDPIENKNKNISYINNTYSEYIGSNIFRIIGMKVQNVVLGSYVYNDKNKIVCACEDFTDENNILVEFENFALSINLDKKIGTEINDIMKCLEEIKNIDLNIVKENFWDMFIIDSLIGNTDRHNGNWGFILNKKNNTLEFSPIYDCGSCLNPLLEDNELSNLSREEIKNLVLNCYSVLKINNNRINYMEFIKKHDNNDCNNAIKRIFNKIKISEISNLIDSINCISDIRKKFYKDIITMRYEVIKDVYNKLI